MTCQVPPVLLAKCQNIRESVWALVGEEQMTLADMTRLVNNHASKIINVNPTFKLELAYLNQCVP